jgi:hypothetical protein
MLPVVSKAIDEDNPSCLVCGRPTYDPEKSERPWARGVAKGRQVLVCPRCQSDTPEWVRMLDECANCGSTRLNVTLGRVICRECGQISG